MTIPPADETTEKTSFIAIPPVPLDGFAPEEFKARREALRRACPEGIILLRGSTEDEAVGTSPYQQNSSFFYLTGVDTPGAYLVLLPDGLTASSAMKDTDSKIREILYLPTRDAIGETWTGPKLGPDEKTEKATGIEKVVASSGFLGHLTSWLRRCSLLYTLTPYGENASGTPAYALMQQIISRAPVAQFRDCAPALANLRSVKSPAELERIRLAISITMEGQKIAEKLVLEGAGSWEFEIEARVLEAYRRKGARLSFGPIVGAGFNATVLHYEDNNCALKEGDLVVVDIGAKIGHYCGDITRTYSVGGKLSARQQEIYSLVQAAYNNTISTYKPGEDSLKNLSDRCKELLKESALRANDNEGKEQTMDTFMPHGLSHHLGLDVHDVGDREKPLEPGAVITIEPGLYIQSESIGVRIEDDFLVTETGLEKL